MNKVAYLCLMLSVFLLPRIHSQEVRVVPEQAAPGAKLVILAEGAGLQSGQATLDLSGVGGGELTLPLTLVGSRLESAPLTLPDEAVSFDGRLLPLIVSLDNGSGEPVVRDVSLATASELPKPEGLLLEVFPRVLTAGEDFAVFVNQADLVDGQVEVDFGPESGSVFTSPLSFSAGRATALGAVPGDAAARVPRLLNLLIDVVDLAGNQQRLIRPVSLNGDSQLADDSPVLDGFSVEPTVLRPGEPFTITTNVDNPDFLGAVFLDFRPLLPSILRLPLAVEDGLGTATGVVPTALPEFVDDFVRIEVVLFSEDGDRRDTRESLFPASGLPSAPDLSLDLETPSDGLLTRNSEVLFSGAVGSGVESVQIGDVLVPASGGSFSATISLTEGTNVISLIARGGDGELSSSSIVVRRDTTPPDLNLEVPRDGAIITSAQTTLAGMVNDLLQGTVGMNDVAVTVNDIPAVVRNRTYEISEFLLVPGENLLEITAIDAAGNSRTITRTVFFEDDAQQQRLVIGAGNNQEGLIGTALGEPLLVQAVDSDGRALSDVPVTFSVIRGDGTVSLDELNERQLTLQTDENGQAFAYFIIGQRTGEGNQRVEVSAPGFTGEVVFCASARDIQAGNIASLVPTTQVGSYGEVLPEPLKVFVSDRGGNPLPNVPVQFQVLEGEGTIYANTEITLFSDDSGRIDAPLLMGTNEDLTSYQVVAVVMDSDPPLMTFFEGQIVMPGAEEDTTFSGVVLDAGNRPLPGVEVHIQGEELRVQTDAEGQFLLTDVPIGDHLLEVEGSTTSVPGTWPHLEFNVVITAGQENHLDQPIYLLTMDDDSARVVGGDQDVVIELAGIPGATLTVFANSVTGPNGESELPVTWTQVNRERVPMPPPLGGQFSVATTVQPANTVFDPPARIQFPNIEGQPGQQVEMFSFDHDLMDYVSIGTGTVSDDGAVVTSDEGFGLVRAGWMGASPPAAPCTGVVTERPNDTPCERWFSLPAPRCAGGVRYVKSRAAILNPTAAASNFSEPSEIRIPRTNLTVFVGDQVGFEASAGSRVCREVQFAWNFGDGNSELGAVSLHQYEEAGEYEASVTIRCVGCPEVSLVPFSQKIRVKVIEEEKFAEFIDSNGRRSIDGLLEIVPPAPGSNDGGIINGTQSESVSLIARTKPGSEIDDFTWEVKGSNGTTQTLEGKTAIVSLEEPSFFNSQRTEDGSFINLLSNVSPDTYEVVCNGEDVGKILVYPNIAPKLTITDPGLKGSLANFDSVIKGVFFSTDVKAELLRGQLELVFAWEECPSTNEAGFSIAATGGFNPFFQIEGEFTIPVEEIVLRLGVGNPTAIGVGIALEEARIAGVAELNLVILPSASFAVTVGAKINGCGVLEGTAPTVSGRVGLEVRLAGVIPRRGEIRMFGNSGITVSAQPNLFTEVPSLENFRIRFDGVNVGVSALILDESLGRFLRVPDRLAEGVEAEIPLFRFQLFDPVDIVGPRTEFLPF